jgi:pimeloyl-ACP methyl ester carboxylesterase
VGLLLFGYIYESIAEAADAKAYPPPGQLVDIGGYRLHLYCTGAGDPTVVIDAGLGDWSTTWGTVQQEVARATRVCAYDRAGLGWSDEGPLPRNAQQHAQELHTLLKNAEVPGPYILVGHSLGGLNVRMFVHDYSSEVAGVVLVDSMSPNQITQPPASEPQSQPFSIQATLARYGVARVVVKLLSGILPAPPSGQEAYYPLYIRPRSLQTTDNEYQGVPASGAQAAAVKTFGDLPLIVLTARLNDNPGWPEWQSELLKLSSNSQQIIAENSGHTVQLDEPQVVVEAILQMIRRVREMGTR